MKIKEIHLQGFKRFADLKIEKIPPTVKLVVLLGPNGCGKSSLFDAMVVKSYEYVQRGMNHEPDYYNHKTSKTGEFPAPVIKYNFPSPPTTL